MSADPIERGSDFITPSILVEAETDERADLLPGEVVAGKYVVTRPLAKGGLGVVVLAKHRELEQRVAIKYLKVEARSDATIVERFRREARLASRLQSEHVVRVHDVGDLPAVGPYMVMEYLEGTDLGKVLEKDGGFPIGRAVDYVLQACDALAEAHAIGIIHRDLKPENMFIEQRPKRGPTLKIIDFGISKVLPKHRAESAVHLTGDGDRFGTPAYMSPEQLRAMPVDARSDIWALGVVLFELITGKLPFDGDDVPTIITSILHDVPEFPAHPRIPEDVRAIVLKCLEKEPARRYRNVAELAHALVRFGLPSASDRLQRIDATVRDSGASIRPPAPSHVPWPSLDSTGAPRPRDVPTLGSSRTSLLAWRVALRAGAALVVLLAGVAGWVAMRSRPASPVPTPEIEPSRAAAVERDLVAPPPDTPPIAAPASAAPAALAATAPPATAPPGTARPTARPAASSRPAGAASHPGEDLRRIFGDRN